MLVSGDAQSNAARGNKVTVLANATELFGNIDQSMPRYDDWLQQVRVDACTSARHQPRLALPSLPPAWF